MSKFAYFTPILIVVTWLTCCVSPILGREICNTYCDGSDPSLATELRTAATVTVSNRLVSVRIADDLNAMIATLENGMTGDNLYLERSFDGGVSWEEIGLRQVEIDASSVSTALFNIDDPSSLSGMGAIRACARARDTGDNYCTGYVRSTYLAGTPHEAAVAALMQFYQDTGKWKTVGWWNAANCLTAMIGYMKITGSTVYLPLIEEAFPKNVHDWWGNFTSDSLDDTAWWALVWIDAFDLTGDTKYLDVAILDTDFIGGYRDNECGDGVWWNIYATYKNAITNELYIKMAAKLATRHPTPEGRSKYLAQAVELWDWFFLPGGMVNDEHLINDGLHECRNNGDKTWTYNQGVILGAAVEIFKATGDTKYLDQARLIVDAVLASNLLSPDGILTEGACETSGGCTGGNNNSFKGVFMRNLGELNRVLSGKPYQEYLERQVESNYQSNRNQMDQYGFRFQGPFDKVCNGKTSVVESLGRSFSVFEASQGILRLTFFHYKPQLIFFFVQVDAARQHSVVDAFNSILA